MFPSPSHIPLSSGTGKTATVVASLKSLLREVKAGTIPEFDAIEINCLRLHSPADACEN
jgi:Cdc6-like AAA superfamily ATPase